MLTLEALQGLLQHVKQGIDSVAAGEPSKQPQAFIDREQQPRRKFTIDTK